MFFQQTVHLTPRGHEIVADALDGFIQQQGLLTRRPAPLIALDGLQLAALPLVLRRRLRRCTGCCRTAAQNWLLLVASYYFYAAWDCRSSACWSLDARRLHLRAGCSTGDRRSGGGGSLLCAEPRVQPGAARILQVLQLLRRQPRTRCSAAVGWQLDFVTLRVLLPIGISFYTFVTMSYVIDVYRREIEPTRNLLDFARVRRVLPAPGRRADPPGDARCCRRSTRRGASPRAQMRDGAVADRLGVLPEDLRRRQSRAGSPTRVFAPDAHAHRGHVLLGVYAFAFQIYGDFAGYSNIARGTSKLMGIELHREFPLPVSRAARRRSSGGTGTSACRPGCATTCTSRSAATAARAWLTHATC